MKAIELACILKRKTGRCSSWDTTGRNADAWSIPARSSRVLADIQGPGVITHIWMTQCALGNEMASVAYWYAGQPAAAIALPPLAKRQRVPKVNGKWVISDELRWTGHEVKIDAALAKEARAAWDAMKGKLHPYCRPEGHSPALADGWQASRLMPPGDVTKAKYVGLGQRAGWEAVPEKGAVHEGFVDVHALRGPEGLVYLARQVKVARSGEWVLHVGHDGGARVFVDGKPVAATGGTVNPAPFLRTQAKVKLARGTHEIVVAFDRSGGKGWGIFVSFMPAGGAKGGRKTTLPA